MTNKLLIFTVIVTLLALSVLCVFCPVVATAETPSDEFPSYETVYKSRSINLSSAGITKLIDVANKAYNINLFGGNVPVLVGLAGNSVNYYQVVFICIDSSDPDLDSLYKINVGNYIYTSDTSVQVSVNNKTVNLVWFALCQNGTLSYKGQGNPLSFSNLTLFVVRDEDTQALRQITSGETRLPTGDGSGNNDLINLDQIIGAYDRILDGYTVGGDGYDEGYTAGYDVGYNNGVTVGREYGYNDGYSVGHDIGYETGYDIGYETGYDNGWETGYDVGFDHGVDMGKGIGYTEGYETGYDDGYETGYDDGYDDGYERGEFDASPITVDIPSVITSVPQSAKTIINNAFGFEIFGINIAGLLSVLLIVAIIGFVVRWLMTK